MHLFVCLSVAKCVQKRHFFLKKTKQFRAKRGFYRAANSIFGKIGRSASEEVIIIVINRSLSVTLLFL